MSDADAHTPPTNQPLTSDGELLIAYLSQRDVPCPACGYNLRQLQRPSCPECGRDLLLSVGVVGGLSNAWITALISALAPAAIGLPFLIGLVIVFGYGATLSDITDEPEGVIVLLLVLYSALCIPITIMLLAMRKRFLAAGLPFQRAVATTLAVIASFASLVAFIMLVSALA